MPDGGSDYEGWPFRTGGSVTCPDCEADSPEFEWLHDLLNWVDGHIPACPGYETDFGEAEGA